MLEFYFWFRSSRLRRRHRRRTILHRPAKVSPNRTIRDIVMTSYPFSKMAILLSISFFGNFAHLGML